MQSRDVEVIGKAKLDRLCAHLQQRRLFVVRVCPLVNSSGEIWRASLNPPRTFLRTETLPRRRQLRFSHLDGHRRRRRPRIAFAVRPTCFRCAAALSACALPAYPRLENNPFRRTRASDVGATLLVFVLGFQSWRFDSEGANRSFDRSRSKFGDPRYRPRGRITKSVTLTTAYNRTILSGTAASAQNKMAKAALHLKAGPPSGWFSHLRSYSLNFFLFESSWKK